MCLSLMIGCRWYSEIDGLLPAECVNLTDFIQSNNKKVILEGIATCRLPRKSQAGYNSNARFLWLLVRNSQKPVSGVLHITPICCVSLF
jgi:hypothetical protein